MMVAPFGNSFDDQLALGLAALDVVGADMGEDARRPWSTRRSMVTTGMPASTASCSAGAMASTSFGLMTMPLTPWVMRRLDVGGLLGRRDLAVALDDADAPSLAASAFICVHHVDEEREGQARHRGQDLVFGMSDGAVASVIASALATINLLVYLRIGWILP